MIVDIANEILNTIKNACTTCTVLSEYPSSTPIFPCIIVEELKIDTHAETIDTSGEKHNQQSFEINIFSNAQNKITQVRDIRATIDNIMSGTYRMTRQFGGKVPNYEDTNIYRYVLRYSCLVDANKKLYRG